MTADSVGLDFPGSPEYLPPKLGEKIVVSIFSRGSLLLCDVHRLLVGWCEDISSRTTNLVRARGRHDLSHEYSDRLTVVMVRQAMFAGCSGDSL